MNHQYIKVFVFFSRDSVNVFKYFGFVWKDESILNGSAGARSAIGYPVVSARFGCREHRPCVKHLQGKVNCGPGGSVSLSPRSQRGHTKGGHKSISGNKVDSCVMVLSDPGIKHKISEETQKLYPLNSLQLGCVRQLQNSTFSGKNSLILIYFQSTMSCFALPLLGPDSVLEKSSIT